MNALKKMRLAKGVSQEYIANKMQVTPATVCRWENGEFPPSTKRLPALAKILGCTIDELLKEGESDESFLR